MLVAFCHGPVKQEKTTGVQAHKFCKSEVLGVNCCSCVGFAKVSLFYISCRLAIMNSFSCLIHSSNLRWLYFEGSKAFKP